MKTSHRTQLLDIILAEQYSDITVPEQASEIAEAFMRSGLSAPALRIFLDTFVDRLAKYCATAEAGD